MPELLMAAVAIGLVLRLSAAAQPAIGDPVHGPACAAHDLQVARDMQRAVEMDDELAAANSFLAHTESRSVITVS